MWWQLRFVDRKQTIPLKMTTAHISDCDFIMVDVGFSAYSEKKKIFNQINFYLSTWLCYVIIDAFENWNENKRNMKQMKMTTEKAEGGGKERENKCRAFWS